MMENENNTDFEAAKDYLSQKQESTAQKEGFDKLWNEEVKSWLANNRNLIARIALENGVPIDEVEEFVESYIATMKAVPAGGEFDDIHIRFTLARLTNEINEVCQEKSFPLHGGVVYGAMPKLSLTMEISMLPGADVGIVTAPQPFIILCNLLSKLVALSLPVKMDQSGGVMVSFETKFVDTWLKDRPEVIKAWIDVIESFARYDYPPPHDVVSPPSRTANITRILSLRAIELFAVAHEYGHHVFKHTMWGSVDAQSDEKALEFEADEFAITVGRAIADKEEYDNHYLMYGVGALLVLGTMEMVDKAKQILLTGSENLPVSSSHPTYLERMEKIEGLDQHLLESHREPAREMRKNFHGLLDLVWMQISPHFVELHSEGIRPEAKDEGGGWLPW